MLHKHFKKYEMKIYLKSIGILIVLLLVFQINYSQNNIQYNGLPFGNCEVLEAQVSEEKIMINISEINLNNGLEQDGMQTPPCKLINLEVTFPKGTPFPITPKDSVAITYTLLQQGFDEYAFNENQLNSIDTNTLNAEGKNLKAKGKSMEEKARAISEKLMNGQITPQEAEKQLMALTNPMLNEIDESAIANLEMDEFDEKTNFSLVFMDTAQQMESQVYSGILRINTFNNTVFDATLEGVEITQCFERRIASAAEARDICKQKQSAYLPDTKVLSEGNVKSTIRFSIEEFIDNR